MPAPKGNKNARKSRTKDGTVIIRIENQLKSTAQEHAADLNLSLSEWITRLIKADLGIK